MVVSSLKQRWQHAARWSALGLLLALPGCCGPLLVSERYGHPLAGPCASEVCQPESFLPQAEYVDSTSEDYVGEGVARPGLPPLPTFCWPSWLNCDRLWMAHHQAKENFTEMLQPGPPPPVKPPHSRFHPVPTQPVFAPRAEYTPPQVLGIKPEDLQMLRESQHAPLSTTPPAEVIPTPIPAAEPIPPAAPAPALLPPMPGSSAKSPGDPTKGPVAQVRFLAAEPNPLRP